jgi:aryl-alcohol dehydrogenase-like predicted oxidoreductase
MLFGESQDYPTACRLLDTCLEAGVNFLDSAEMYPVPQRAETQGKSEQHLGRWMKQHSRWAAIVAVKCVWRAALYAPRSDSWKAGSWGEAHIALEHPTLQAMQAL